MVKKRLFRLVSFLGVLALAAMSCGAFDLGSIFATATPTPTLTFTPTPTLTPTNTPTPTSTPTPTNTPLPTGVQTNKQADGSTLFIDHDNKFQMVIPGGWVAIPITTEDIAGMLQELSKDNPDIKSIADTFSQLDPDVVRLIAVNKDKKYTTNGFATNITVIAFNERIMASMPLDFVSGSLEENMKQGGAKIISPFNPAEANPNGVETTQFEFEQTTPTSIGTKVRVRSGILLFQTKNKLLMIQLATLQQFAGELMPALKQIGDSVQLLEP
ncbi:MAG: hypothetical protein ACOYYF_15575 [Chloroflexota bacterium]|nr:hypothetical protein [Chloroflexota bacterium]MBI5704734.1 hypothetical protein [Chloroflexota bacterium]